MELDISGGNSGKFMLLNISNHPYSTWSDSQKDVARQFGNVHDIAFPELDPEWDSVKVFVTAQQFVERIKTEYPARDSEKLTIHIMGEMTFTYAAVRLFQKSGFRCIASTTKRIVEQQSEKKVSYFKFVQFRDYSDS